MEMNKKVGGGSYYGSACGSAYCPHQSKNNCTQKNTCADHNTCYNCWFIKPQKLKQMKKQIKKLTLNKKTISNLTDAEMSRHIGGWTRGHCGGYTTNCTQNNGKTCNGHNTCYNYNTCDYYTCIWNSKRKQNEKAN